MQFVSIIKSIFMLFAIVNPIGSIPLVLQITNNIDKSKKAKVFRTAIFTSVLILFIFILAGDQILTNIFQIQLRDLMAAGGLLLLIIAIDHLIFGTLANSVLKTDQQDPHHIGAVPIACPILAGPGAMMSVLVIFSEHGFATAAISIISVFILTWLIFNFIDRIYLILGKIICSVLSKILCLFIAAVGIRLFMSGLISYFK